MSRVIQQRKSRRSLTTRLTSTVVVALAVALVAACGSATSTQDAVPTTSGPLDPVPGCGEKAATDLQVRTDFVTPRCDPGSPAPRPLPEKTTIKVGLSSKTAELALPILLGLNKGEYAKENLDVEVQVLAPDDSLSLLAQGQLDAVVTNTSAAFFNAVAQGFDIRWALSLDYNGPDNDNGLWIKGANAGIEQLRGKTVASAAGIGSSASYPIEQAMRTAGMSLKDVKLKTLPATDIALALENGSVDAGIMVDPFWLQLRDRPGYTHLVDLGPPGEPVAGVLFGPSLTKRNRSAGTAFARAYARIIDTYLPDMNYKTGPYKTDIAAAIGGTDLYFKTPPQAWDWEVKKGTTDRLQETFISLGAVNYQAPIPETKIVDRSFIEEAIGHRY